MSSGLSGILKISAVIFSAALISSVFAGCDRTEPSGSSLETEPVINTEIVQSQHTTVVLETVTTEITPTNTPTPTATPVPTLTPEERIVTVSFAGDCTLTQDYRSSNRQFDSTVDGNMEY